MNEKRLKLVGDAFALYAFALPLPCLALAVLARHSEYWLIWIQARALPILDQPPVNILGWMIALCGLGGIALMLMGRITQTRRLIWQGLFAVCISLALTGSVLAFSEYGLRSYDVTVA